MVRKKPSIQRPRLRPQLPAYSQQRSQRVRRIERRAPAARGALSRALHRSSGYSSESQTTPATAPLAKHFVTSTSESCAFVLLAIAVLRLQPQRSIGCKKLVPAAAAMA